MQLQKIMEGVPGIQEQGFRYFEIDQYYDVSINIIEENTKVPNHTHDQDVFNYVLQGEFIVIQDDTSKIYKQNDLIFISANTVHAVETKSEVTLLELWRK